MRVEGCRAGNNQHSSPFWPQNYCPTEALFPSIGVIFREEVGCVKLVCSQILDLQFSSSDSSGLVPIHFPLLCRNLFPLSPSLWFRPYVSYLSSPWHDATPLRPPPWRKVCPSDNISGAAPSSPLCTDRHWPFPS